MEPQAVVGFSFKLPQGVTDDSTLWDVLVSRRNLAAEWPSDRAQIDSFHSVESGVQNKLPTRLGHFLSQDIAAFDAPFFSITAQEAEAMDPQQRWILETTYHAFENAGIPMESLRGSRTGVFAGSMADDFTRLLAKDPDTMPRTAITGTSPSLLANKVSWFYNLTGPSMHVDSACSSSLTALDLACQALRNGSASQAVVIGSSVMLSPESSTLLSNMSFLSPDGVSYSFDHRASGYARGEGIIVMIIKPIMRAVEDRDMIRAVIRATLTNQDGRTPGLTQPSAESQKQLIRDIYHRADLDFDSTRYVEAHGTGTPVGDPTEMEAIRGVFAAYRSTDSPLYIGSVKPNIGHLEGGSGLAGILKSILVLEKGTIPPNALFDHKNPGIDDASASLVVPTTSTIWPSPGLRRISVNSFGFGGSNCHVILDDSFHYLMSRSLSGLHNCRLLTAVQGQQDQQSDPNSAQYTNSSRHTQQGDASHNVQERALNSKQEAIPTIRAAEQGSFHLLVWSAHDEGAMSRVIESHELYYTKNFSAPTFNMDELVYTLAARRSLMAWRAFSVVNDRKDVSSTLHATRPRPIRASNQVNLAMVFTGQGAQHALMGLELLQYQVFESTLRQADSALRNLGCTWSIFDVLKDDEKIHLPQHSQPLCTAVQLALFSLIRSFGLVPTAVIGHSSGEIAAAYAIGALSLQSAMKVAFYRGYLAGRFITQKTIRTGMISVALSDESAQSYLHTKPYALEGSNIHVACINSQINVTLSGDEETIDRLKADLESDGIFTAKLNTGVAYHSPMMRQISQTYSEALDQLEPGTPLHGTVMVSSVTGKSVTPEDLSTSQYWVDNLIQPVRFSDAIFNLLCDQQPEPGRITDIIEIGPHAALQRPIKEILSHRISEERRPRYHSTLHKSKPADFAILSTLGELFCVGHSVSITKTNLRLASLEEHKQPIPFLIDGPKYPFDHSRRFWRESRLARDYRLRVPVPKDSLGSRVHDWNPLEPRWRNLISKESIPWVADHVISEKTVFPGAGMLVMAIEAVRQMSYADRAPFGYYIREAHFMNPMLAGETPADSTESLVHLRCLQDPFEKDTTRFEVTIYAYNQQRWTRCFEAVVQAQYKEPNPQAAINKERDLASEQMREMHQKLQHSCTQGLSSRRFYDYCESHGFRYGDSFQLLDDMHWDGRDGATAWIGKTSLKCETESLFCPPMLDAAFHLNLVQVSSGLSRSVATMVPYQLFNAWFSATGWDDMSPAQVSSFITDTTPSNTEATIMMISSSGKPLAKIGKLVMAAVSSRELPGGAETHDRLIHSIEWKPQLSLQTPSQLEAICNMNYSVQDEAQMTKFFCTLESALVGSIRNTLATLSRADVENIPAHLQKLVLSMRYQIEQLEAPRLGVSNEIQVEEILSCSEKNNPGWRIFPVVARNLKAILLGEVDALDIVYSTGLADSFYRSIFDHICDTRFRKFFELLTHETPTLKVIEVGAGTGGLTRHVLSCLDELEQRSGTGRYSEYHYTDISPSFFENARSEFNGPKISFAAFNIEVDATQQGIENGTYDLVVAGGVIHATKNLENTLSNVRKLLKPGGHLLLVEIINPGSIHANLGFGVLPGWWLSEEKHRAYSPAITETQWDWALRKTRFSGSDLVLRDYNNDACHFSSLIVSTAIEEPRAEQRRPRLIILVEHEHSEQFSLAKQISQHLGSDEILLLRDMPLAVLTTEDIVVSLLDVNTPFLAAVSETDFLAMQQVIRMTTKLCWVSSSSPQSRHHPYHSLPVGMLRTVRAEAIEKRIITLSVESGSEARLEDFANWIRTVLQASIDSDHPELEFVVRDGYLSSGRMVEDISMSDQLRGLVDAREKSEPLGKGPPLQLSVGTSGLLDTLHFTNITLPGDDLGPGEVEIEAKAWAVSFRDVLVALGRVKGSDLGWDAAGTILSVGPGCDLAPGDRVGIGAPGSMRTLIRADSRSVFRIPTSMSFDEAASFINPACTAYHCLINVARLRMGEKVLIHSAAGATGQMALWIAKYCGAEIFATVGTEEKKQLLVERFGLDPDHIFHSRDTSFAQGVTRLTKDYGVDVILNSLSGDGLRASWDIIAPYGRFIEIGKADITSNSSLSMANFQKNVSFFAVDLHHMVQTRLDTVSEVMHNVLHMILRKDIQYPHPLHHFGASDIERAFRTMQGGLTPGRIIVRLDSSEPVPKFTRDRTEWRLDPNASYVVAGGLGGLGRAICEWLTHKGVRHLILLSRSGAKTNAAIETLRRLQDRGVHTKAIACDVTSSTSLASALDACAGLMPRVKGCINAAMALQDGIFDTLAHSRWTYTMESKVNTSWNLHQLLPKGLDFFVQLSSLSGLYGTISLSNYAAGCTFQDSLARYRNLLGENAIALDIGWMRTIGIIAETELYQRNREKAQDMRPIEEPELLALLDLCCDPSSPYGRPGEDKSQVLIGATTPAFFLRRGEKPIPQVQSRMFSGFTSTTEAKKTASASRSAIEHVALFRQAKEPKDRSGIVMEALAGKLARALSVTVEYIDFDMPLSHYGVDSLMAVELRNWFINDFDAKVAVFEIMGNTPIVAIAKLVAERTTGGV